MNDWLSTFAVSAVTIGLAYTYFTSQNGKKKEKEDDAKDNNESDSSTEEKTLPGPPKSHPQLGNIMDIGAAGGYYHYLKKLHKEYGDVVSFYFADKLTVSVCTPQLYRAMAHAFDRPAEMWEIFMPLMAKECIAFQNGAEGKKRRRTYDSSFSHAAMGGYYDGLTTATEELMEELSEADLMRLPSSQWTLKHAMKCILRECFGDYFTENQQIVRMKDNFDFCWHELESRAGGQFPEPGSPKDVEFNQRRDDIYDCTRAMIKHRKNKLEKFPDTPRKFIDIVMDYGGDDASLVESDLVDYILAGYMSTGDLMTWCFYLLSTHPEVQEKLYSEIIDVLGDTESPTFQNTSQLPYMKQVLDEALRYSLLGTFTIRYAEKELNLDGYTVPADATCIQAIGITHMDEKYWPNPEKFDPERFTSDKKASRPRYSFVPFGFAGGRQCPGFRFTYVETTLLLANLVRKYSIEFSANQPEPERIHGLLTFLKDEIYVNLIERSPNSINEAPTRSLCARKRQAASA